MHIPPCIKWVQNTTSTPAHLHQLENFLKLDSFIDHTERIFKEEIPNPSDSADECEGDHNHKDRAKQKNRLPKHSYKNEFSSVEWEEEKSKFYNLKSVGAERTWLQDVLLDCESDDKSSPTELAVVEEQYQNSLKMHLSYKKINKSFSLHPSIYLEKYGFFGASLVLEHDKYHDRQKKRCKTGEIIVTKKTSDENIVNTAIATTTTTANTNTSPINTAAAAEQREKAIAAKLHKQQLQKEKDLHYKRRKLWNIIAKKEIPKVSKARANRMGTAMQTLKKVAQTCQREMRKEAVRSQKVSKETVLKARKIAKEMLLYWRRFDKVEKEHRKKAEKEAMEQRRQDEEMREMKRQQRKLNFLITQTELYAHFMGKKMKGLPGTGQDSALQHEILKKLDDPAPSMAHHSVHGGVVVNNAIDDYDLDAMKTQAVLNAQNAVLLQEKKISAFDVPVVEKKPSTQKSFDSSFSLANPSEKIKQHPQPKTFDGLLKSYQLKGMNWIINLYEQGINGILADEMGLGKTVQSIAFLAYLAEVHDIWGPFLIVAPASTLHNWQQEFSRFLPIFKVLPYWGDPGDRKSLRKFWNQKSSYMNDSKGNAPFHVLITSYQLIVQDVKYFQRIKWQYLVLDEAHAIKSSASIRWKILLGYNCRNRLLLTGTPIQNTMAELWALLHFIMPTLFDSHEEFNEWFSKDIENHAAEKRPNLDQNQLSRLHMILKPFMLRRIKKDVENELSEKIEIKVMCDMSTRQKQLYQAVKNKIMYEDLLQSASTNAENKSTSLLMNLVMQFRKVCNHPEIFERKEPTCGLHFKLPSYCLAKMFYRNCFLSQLPSQNLSKFQIWSPSHIHQSLQETAPSCFSFTRFINLSPNECLDLFKSLVTRLRYILLALKHVKTEDEDSHKPDENICTKYLTRRDLFIYHQKPQLSSSEDLCFIKPNDNFAEYNSCLIKEIRTSRSEQHTIRFNQEPVIRTHVSVFYPNFLTTPRHKVISPPRDIYCNDRSAAYQFSENMYGPTDLLKILQSGTNELSDNQNKLFFPSCLQGCDAARPYHGWSNVKMPDRCSLLTDCGKLMVLDQLLVQMKLEDHRVLIYSQMTKMIDILEEFMNYRQYSYMRLDGSSKIADRRDMVANFQARDDIFAFLLSTRAGGLGINLTAADTVIFYDSDWNPTVDQQAMDRAHRLGQTRQVTVYRLVTKGTIEEKIINRAREKSEIQNIVISGGQFNKDVLRPKEVVSLLLDDEELEAKLKQRQIEKKVAEESGKRPGRKRKLAQDSNSPPEKRIKNDNSDDVSVISDNSTNLELIDIDENSASSLDVALSVADYDSTEVSSRPPSTTPCSPSPSPVQMSANRGRGKVIRGGGNVTNGRINTVIGGNNGTVGVSTPKGRGKVKSGTLAKAAASAAAAAGAAAGSAAAYAAYGYSFQAVNKNL